MNTTFLKSSGADQGDMAVINCILEAEGNPATEQSTPPLELTLVTWSMATSANMTTAGLIAAIEVAEAASKVRGHPRRRSDRSAR